MRVSAKAEYACVAMLELAANHQAPQPVRVKAIADAHGISQRFLVQILLQLKGAGLVTSVRGSSGGYQLTRTPETISLAEILDAIDGAATARPEPTGYPDSALYQTVREVWEEAQAQERRLLRERSLAELVRRSERNHALTYEI